MHKIAGGELCVPEEELLDVRWLTYNEIMQLQADGKIRSQWVADIVTKVEKNENSRH